MTDIHYPQDCISCRADALGLNDDQRMLITEVVMAALEVGYKTREQLPDDGPNATHMSALMALTSEVWAQHCGTLPIPESDEVRNHGTHR